MRGAQGGGEDALVLRRAAPVVVGDAEVDLRADPVRLGVGAVRLAGGEVPAVDRRGGTATGQAASILRRQGRFAMKSISTSASRASPVTPMLVRAGSGFGRKYVL